MEFRWNQWNIEHVAKHGVHPEEAEAVVAGAIPPFPRDIGDGMYLVCGPAPGGRMLQVIYVPDPGETVYIIHARPL